MYTKMNQKMKKEEVWRREISPNSILYPVSGSKAQPFVTTPCAEGISDTNSHLYSYKSINQSAIFFKFEMVERTCNFSVCLLLILLVTCFSDFWLFQRWQWSTPLAQENERA